MTCSVSPLAENITPAQDAKNIREDYWGLSVFPVDPFAIATKMGLSVYLQKMPPNLAGYIGVDPQGITSIFINQDHPFARKNFTCAHELGHYIGNQKYDHTIPAQRDELAHAGNNLEEMYANRFAAALLMPSPAVKEKLTENPHITPEDLAQFFSVSVQAMKIRLKNLGYTLPGLIVSQ